MGSGRTVEDTDSKEVLVMSLLGRSLVSGPMPPSLEISEESLFKIGETILGSLSGWVFRGDLAGVEVIALLNTGRLVLLPLSFLTGMTGLGLDLRELEGPSPPA